MRSAESNHSNIWDLYGLKGNPFSPNPIGPENKNDMPIEGFEKFKRINDFLDIIKNRLESESGTISVVYGETGVGKTSFVNYALHLVENKRFYVKVDVEHGWTKKEFVINTLSKILNSLGKFLDKKTIKEIVVNSLTIFGYSLMKRVSNLSISDLKNIIGNNEKNSIPIDSDFLEELFKSITKRLYTKYGKELIIVYDDLGNLNGEKDEEEIETIEDIFNSLRDNVFRTNNVHFVFICDPKTNFILHGMQRIRDVLSKPSIFLREMNKDEIIDVIEHRIEVMRKRSQKSPKPLYGNGVLELLYDIYGGNIRSILNRLNSIFGSYASGKPITKADVIANIKKEVKANIQALDISHKPKKEKEIINYLARSKSKNGKAKSGNIAHALGISNSEVRRYIEKDLGDIIYQSVTAKDIYWTLDPEIRWLIKNHYLTI